MPRFCIKLANKLIEIDCIYRSTKKFCKSYLVKDNSSKFDVSISISKEDLEAEAKYNNWHHKSLTIFKKGYEYLEVLAVYRKIATELIKFDTLLIHGSVISVDNEAYMFLAPSGTGKSTHTRLWMKHFGNRSFMVNDDKPLIIINDDGAFACGTPWSGKHNLNTNTIVPLRGLCFFYRNETNTIEQLSIENSYEYALLQTFRPNDDELSIKTFDLLDKLLATTPFYKMGLNNFADDALETSFHALASKSSSASSEAKTIEEFIRSGNTLYKTISGISMEPLLHNRQSIVKIEKANGILKKNDVVLFIRNNGDYVLHRIVKVRRNDYLICGDNQWVYERIPHGDVIGIMTEYTNDGEHYVSVSSDEYKEYVDKHCKYYWLKYHIKWMKAFPGRATRKLVRIIKRG